jgi:phage-related protein
MTVNTPVFSNLQSINPSAIIELFVLQLSTAIHGTNTTYRFHNGSSLNANGEIVWAGNDLTGAVVTRIRTLAKFLDATNFADGTNATADNTAEFPQEIYYIDRKSTETRDVVAWELAAVFDLAGIRVPKRQCTRAEFPSIGTFR